MALTYSWNSITAAQCDADSPLDEILMEDIRQNLIFLYEWIGKDYTAAENHHHDGVDSALTPYSANYSSGNYKIAQSLAMSSKTFDINYTKCKEIIVVRGGTLTISFDLRVTEAYGPAVGRIYRNNSPVGSERATYSGSWTTFSENISEWNAGDLCQLYYKSADYSSSTVDVKDFILKNSFFIGEVVNL